MRMKVSNYFTPINGLAFTPINGLALQPINGLALQPISVLSRGNFAITKRVYLNKYELKFQGAKLYLDHNDNTARFRGFKMHPQ